jgi:hydroxyacylglutathione hydrolase
VSTIGEQRRTNYALAPMTREQFVEVVTEGQPTAPAYFSYDAQLNRTERPLLDEDEAPAALSLDDVAAARGRGAVVIDTRDAAEFARGHLSGSIDVGLGGRFAEFVGAVVGPDQSVVLVGEPGTELEAKVRLGRIGFDRVAGYLADPYRELFEHPDLVSRSSRVTAAELRSKLAHADASPVQVIDVRSAGEFSRGAVAGARNIPLPELTRRLGDLDPTAPVVVNCAGGYRSAIAASLLEANGFDDVSDLLGGYAGWASTA